MANIYRYTKLDNQHKKQESSMFQYFQDKIDFATYLRDCKFGLLVIKKNFDNVKQDLMKKKNNQISKEFNEALLKYVNDNLNNIKDDKKVNSDDLPFLRIYLLLKIYLQKIYELLGKVYSENKEKFFDDFENVCGIKSKSELVTNILTFVNKYDVQIFKDYLGVYMEQYREWTIERSEKCEEFYVELFEKNVQIISMFVWKLHFNDKHYQEHISIVKNIFYSFYKHCKKEIEPVKVSILLHSFASWAFKSDTWFTFPLQSMATILDENKIKYQVYHVNEKFIKDFLEELKINKNGCYSGLYFGGIQKFFFIDTKQMELLWLNNNNYKETSINNIKTFILSPIQKGGNDYYHKYLKYKKKYYYLKSN